MNWRVISRILWPERASLFVIVGGAIGLAGDLTSFFAEFISPALLVWIAAGISAIAALLCFQRALMVNQADDAAVTEVANCSVCDALRFGLFATAAFILILIVGQGQSVTRTVGEQLGLIQEDVSVIREDVSEISEVVEAQQIIDDPESAADYFTNAWLYANMRRDQAAAMKSLDEMYARFAPNKLDAADLYFNTGRQIMGRNQLLAVMEATGRKIGDATLLVIAARNVDGPEEANRLKAAAREIDPEQPFAYWDLMEYTNQMRAAGGDGKRHVELMREQVAMIDEFTRRYGDRPASAYFFMPQYQPDYSALARDNRASYVQSIESYDRAQDRLQDALRKAGRQ